MRAADLRSSPARRGRELLPELDPARVERVSRAGLLIAIALAAGVAAAFSPWALLVGALAVLGIWLVAYRDRPRRVFSIALVALLVGYALCGRGLAHIGVPPVYVGEVVLILGVVAMLVSVRTLRGGPIRWLIVAFMAWGALQTFPYVGKYGVDAFRDAVTWGYGLFALFVSLMVTAPQFRKILSIYRAFIPLYLVWVPVTLILSRVAPGYPGGIDALIAPKPGDMGVLLAGIAAFALLGLYSASPKPRVPESIMWLLWLPAAGVVSIFNRGGMVAIVTAGAALLFLRLPRRWLPPVFMTVLITVLLVFVDPRLDIGQGRTISVGQVADNITSLITDTGDPALEGTKEFRLRWWTDIINYTVFGPYFWTGKGFGINLADADGFQVYADHSLRAPHNGHLEILARAGVPGLLLWILLNAAIGIGLLRAAARARAMGRNRWVAIDGWLFVAWAAALVNASFDPSLQGPHAGIWFWSMVGLAIAAVEFSTRTTEEPEPETSGDATEAEPRAPGAARPVPRPA